MASQKGYVPGQYPVLQQGNSTRKFITQQLQQISAAITSLNTQANTNPVKFATLPNAAAQYAGTIRCVSDSTVNTWGSTVTGGGTHTVLCWCNGTAWTVLAA
jgi:hypothetical protein